MARQRMQKSEINLCRTVWIGCLEPKGLCSQKQNFITLCCSLSSTSPPSSSPFSNTGGTPQGQLALLRNATSFDDYDDDDHDDQLMRDVFLRHAFDFL